MSNRSKRGASPPSPSHSSSSDSDDFDPNEFIIAEGLKKRRVVPVANTVNNVSLLDSKLSDYSYPPSLPWIESLWTSPTSGPLSVPDPNDDLAREAQFYSKTLESVSVGISKLKEFGVPFVRPTDYYAEMVKPDSQMNRIKDSLLFEKRKMDAVSQRKKLREEQKFQKHLQSEKVKEKAKLKRTALDETKKLRGKTNQNNVDSLRDEVKGEERSFLPGFESLREATSRQRTESRDRKINRKRERKDAKYGFGGKKKFIKSNDSKSTNDVRDFSVGKNKRSFKGFGDEKPGRKSRGSEEGRGRKRGKPNRPGKEARKMARIGK